MGHVEDNMDMFLQGLGLEKYVNLFYKKAIKFDTFINMTLEDMDSIGIKDESDKIKLYDALKPLLHLYKDINELPPLNEELLVIYETSQMRNLLGKLILLKRTLQRNKMPQNMLVDASTPVSKAIEILVDKALDSVKLIEQDMSQTLRNVKKKNRTPFILGSVAIAGVLMFYCKKYYF